MRHALGQGAESRGDRGGSTIRTSLVAVLLLFLASVLLTACESPQPPLRVATIQWIGYQPLHLARQLDYFPPNTVRLADFSSNTESLRAFRNRNVEVAALTLDEVLLLRDDGHDARVILIMDYSEGADAIVARPEIETLADLKGKRIGVESTAATAYLLARALEFGALTTDDVHIIKLAAGDQEAAYRENRVDAVATFEPLRTRLNRLGAHDLFDSRSIPGEIVDVLVTRGDIIDDTPERLEVLLESWFEAVRYANTRPGDTAARLAPRASLSEAEFREAMGGMRFPSLAENCRLLGADAAPMQEVATRLQALMVDTGLLDGNGSSGTLFDARVLQRLGCNAQSPVAGDSQ